MSGRGFVSYLGPNTFPIARRLGDRLTDELGTDFTHPSTPSWPELQAIIDDGSGQLFWLCGLLTVELIDSGRLDAEILAAPVFPGESGPVYHTVVIANRSRFATTLGDLAGGSLAINGTGSWSGYHALRVHLAQNGHRERFFGRLIETGGHDASIDRVLAGDADCAAVDSSVWTYRSADAARLGRLEVVTRTRDWPAPPFAVSRSMPVARRRALAASLTRNGPSGLAAIVPAVDADYDPIRHGMKLAERVAW